MPRGDRGNKTDSWGQWGKRGSSCRFLFMGNSLLQSQLGIHKALGINEQEGCDQAASSSLSHVLNCTTAQEEHVLGS